MKFRIAIVVVCLILFTIVGVGISKVVSFERESSMTVATSNSVTLASALEFYISAIFSKASSCIVEVQNQLEIMSARHQKMTPLELTSMLAKIKASYPEVEISAISDAEGRYVASSEWSDLTSVEIEAQRLSFGDRDYFQQQKSKADLGTVISDPVVGHTNSDLVIALSRRLESADHKFAGIIVATIKLKAISDFFSTLRVGNSGSITLWNDKRVLLARFPYLPEKIGLVIPQTDAMSALFKSGVEHSTFESVSPVDQRLRVVSFSRVKNLPFVIVVGKTTEEILAAWQKNAVALLSIAAAFAFAVIACAAVLMRQRRS